ncbi:DNA-binding MarR family transcriptional regulator [Endozoicomonas sp. NE40]|uniref:DNA-binding MarR family transcriptional regulator n=2 Tax=Endozoicomonas lisbonensis TaxID=3120522 RepID=A0ABV2SIP7_9GAMM
MLARGKKGREKKGMNLLLVEDDMFDKRRKNLKLTEAGERVIKAIKPLLK